MPGGVRVQFLTSKVVLCQASEMVPSLLNDGHLALAHIPSDAFGDGSHPTTRLCAAAVDLLCRTRKPRAVLDVGTGTGVLARIARARGVPHVMGTDIDLSALEAARTNAALDRPADCEISWSTETPDAWGSRFDLVVANILEGPLRELAPALVNALLPGGQLLLSGFTLLQVPALRIAFGKLKELGCSQREGWVLLHYEKDLRQ